MSDTTPLKRSRTLPGAPLQATDLPTSPPPTSPLPPTPIQSPTPPSSVFLTYPSIPPQRPPRPQTSLPNLRPLMVFSPELKIKADQYRAASPVPHRKPHKLVKRSRDESTNSTLPTPQLQPQNIARTLESPGSFTTAVFDALPVENWPLPAEPCPPPNQEFTENNNIVSSTSQSIPGRKRNRKPPTRAVARTALYIPQSAAFNSSLELRYAHDSYPYRPKQPIFVWTVQDENITSLPPWPGIHHNRAISDPGTTSITWSYPNLFHKRNQSDITPPPRSFLRYWQGSSLPSVSIRGSLQSRRLGVSLHAGTLPTIEAIGKPESNNTTSGINNSNSHSNNTTIVNSEYTQQPPNPVDVERGNTAIIATTTTTTTITAPQSLPWYVRRKRYMWMLATLILVLVATAGVLGGIFWRLRHI